MKSIQLVDTQLWDQLNPITLTKTCADIRLGIFTIREKWQNLNQTTTILSRPYLQALYENSESAQLKVNSALLPNQSILREILNLGEGESIYQNEIWIATNGDEKVKNQAKGECHLLCHPEDLFIHAGSEIKKDIKNLVGNNNWIKPSLSNTIIGEEDVFLSEGTKMECCILNTEEGPIYIGPNAHIMEGTIIRGPVSIGHNTILKMGARIYMNTSIGPWCKVGGEVKNSVILGNSNKAHDGYMGNSVIGEWCNWGADTNNSNMKNNYTNVKLWDYSLNTFRNTGLQFVGLIMGDHSKTGINTMFNTGTVMGVSCNIYGTGFPRKFIPSFSWGGVHGFKTYQLNRALDTAKAVQKRRDIDLPKAEVEMLNENFTRSSKYRKWEKL